MSSEKINKVLADYFAATRAMDCEAWVNTFADDAVSYDPVGAPPTEGHNGLRQFFANITGVFDKVGITEKQIFIAGDEAAVTWVGHGIGKNGREVSFEGIDVFQINDAGKIQMLWGYWDPAAMMAKLQG